MRKEKFGLINRKIKGNEDKGKSPIGADPFTLFLILILLILSFDNQAGAELKYARGRKKCRHC